MNDLHFGYPKNNHTCSCGRHHGIGDITPEDRAARSKRMSEAMPSFMSDSMVAFLADWEKQHGTVHYRMDMIGRNGGNFIKSNKGQDFTVAVFVDIYANSPDDLFSDKPKRTDIHG